MQTNQDQNIVPLAQPHEQQAALDELISQANSAEDVEAVEAWQKELDEKAEQVKRNLGKHPARLALDASGVLMLKDEVEDVSEGGAKNHAYGEKGIR